MGLKITVLVENHVSVSNMFAEHGLSFLIECNNNNILFDVGQTNVFAMNAKRLGKDLGQVNCLVISHGHYDHVGGLPQFIEDNNSAQIYSKKGAFAEKYNGERYIGVSKHINTNNKRFSIINGLTELVPNVFVVPSIKTVYDIDSHKKNFSTVIDSEKQDDDFLDELFIAIKEEDGLTLISSCSHNGITNILESAIDLFKLPVKRVIGGFHIRRASDEAIQHIVDYFNKAGVQEVFTGHCTGIKPFIALQKGLNAKVEYLETGIQIDI